MIIDARHYTGGHPGTRPNSLRGALKSLLDSMDAGATVTLKSAIDQTGAAASPQRIQTYIAQVSRGRRFTTRTLRDGGMILITRVA